MSTNEFSAHTGLDGLTGRAKESNPEVHVRSSVARTAIEEWKCVAALTRDVSIALNKSNNLRMCLQDCAQGLVTNLNAAFARIWTLNQETQVLELQASAGMYTHLDGPHGRVPVGSLKIGLIASERRPHLTNAVIGDPRVSDQEWAAREKMIAFAGYPLLIEDNVVGVMALFSRQRLSTTVLDAMDSIANAIALGIEQKRGEEFRDMLWRETERARALAETALRVRTDFLSSVSHDLKTPISAIGVNVQLLQRRLKREGTIEPKMLGERLAMIESSVTKMAGMVEELLDAARLQAGLDLDLDKQHVELCTLLREISAEQQLMTKRHQLLVELPEEEIMVLGDPLRLDRALTNLVANAIKYSPHGGTITICLRLARQEDQSLAVISIQDQGLGIPAADLPHIFDPFYRAGNVSHIAQGTGLGLAGVAQIISGHGGVVTVESTEGQGSTFTLQLPCLC